MHGDGHGPARPEKVESVAKRTDSSGNVWLFGGQGYDAAGHFGFLSDLWKYSNCEWTWMGGSDLADSIGFYGAQGAANPTYFRSARNSSRTWIDAQGNLWLFGGSGYDATATLGDMNDLWMYKP